MAITQNTYTGNGSTTAFSFTFPYLDTTDIKVSLDAADTTAYTLSNATTITFNTAPATGVAIRIYRNTATDNLQATFYPGSAIRSSDLNNNFTQNLYVTQEVDFDVATANTTANTAKTTADTAIATANTASTNANTAVSTANTASTNASAAVTTANAASSTANTASTNASNAVSTANTASTNASAAVTTANTADANATTALNNSRESDGSGGFNSAIDKANTAITTANSASTSATSAVSTANTASTNATNALNTANAASAAVTNAVLFTLIANVAAIPGSPSNNDYIEIGNSTGIQSFSPLSGLPSGFVGATGLTVRIRYDSSASSWVFMSYFANDSETRYLTKNVPVVTGDSTNGSGQITLNCENNSHGVKIKGPPHSAAATYTLTLPNNTGTSGQALKTDGSGVLSFSDVSSSFITQTDFAYKPTSNSLTFNAPGSPSSIFGFDVASNNSYFRYNTDDSTISSQMANLSVGDTVSFTWTLSNGSTATTTNTISNAAADATGSGYDKQIAFSNNLGHSANTLTQVKLTHSSIVNGVEPISNNQVLRYKTASSKWTVDDVDTAFIETPQTISTDKVIAASTNAGMMGPTVAISSGNTISVGANSILTVLK